MSGRNAVYATWRPDLVRWVDKIGIFFVSIWRFLTSRLTNLTFGLISGNNLVSSVTKGMFNFSNSINSIMDWIPLKTVLTKTIELKYRNYSFKPSPCFHDFWPLPPSVDIFLLLSVGKLYTVSFENFVKSKVMPSFCFPFKIPDDTTATNKYIRLWYVDGSIVQ